MFLSREEKERRVIDLYSQGKTTREIIKELRVSPNYVSAILKKEEEKNNSIVTNNQQQSSSVLATKVYELFSKGNTPLQVSIALNIKQSDVAKYFREYWKLQGLHKLNFIYVKTNGKIWPVWKLYQRLVKKKCISIEQVVNVVEIAIHRLPYMENLYQQSKDQAEKMQRTIQRLANDIAAKEYKISILDKIAISSEQECRRKHQEIQDLTAQKNRLERLIANILNGEGYSKVKQIVKENVKATLSEEKKVISVCFAATIQTLTADPQMVKLIQNIPSANDGEQYKDNDNSITKYLESNQDGLLDLTEKHYENLVEALTNNAIDNAGAFSSSNPTLSLPQSSSIFPGPLNKIAIYRIEEPEDYHNNSKGDISD